MNTSINQILASYKFDFSSTYVEEEVQTIIKLSYDKFYNSSNLKKIFGSVDLTSLNTDDTIPKIKRLVEKVNRFNTEFADIDNVAAICVYPSFIDTVKENLQNDKVNIASVAACFPSAQSFIEVKKFESKMVMGKGVHELDVVISVGSLLEGNYQKVYDEIVEIKNQISNCHLKVILETGALKNPQNIYIASIISLLAGADFIKTSTGKVEINATHEAVYIMCKAIKNYYIKTNKKAGIKVAGGIKTPKAAIEYFVLVNHILGSDWLNKNLFRIGASSLCNNILTQLARFDDETSMEVKYF